MKKLLLLMLGALIALPTLARDFEYTYEGKTLTYTVIDETAKTVKTKAGVRSESNYNAGNYVTGKLTLPSTVYDGTTKYTLVSIGAYAFFGCSGLTTVTIPNSVSEIGESAFRACSGLTSVTIPNSVTRIGNYAFMGCSGMTSVTIPNSVTKIGDSAFDGCSGLTSINIPNSVTEIGYEAFRYCSNLKSVTIPNSVTKIDQGTFRDCRRLTSVTIPNSVTQIGSSAFEGCSGLTSINIPNSVTEIGGYAFQGCSGLTSVTIPNSVTQVGSSAFEGCSGLTSVTIGNSVTKIDYKAFRNCSGLTSLTIPYSVTKIGDYAFEGCTGLTTIKVINSIPPTIEDNSFSGLYDTVDVTIPQGAVVPYISSGWSLFKKLHLSESGTQIVNTTDGTLNYSLIPTATDNEKHLAYVKSGDYSGEITIPEFFTYTDSEGNSYRYYVSGLGYHAFTESSITKVNFDSSIDIKTISNGAFMDCYGLTSVTIPNSVTKIGDSAFEDCRNLNSVTLGNSVIEIGKSSFEDCRHLTSITLPNSVTMLGDRVFEGCENMTAITIPNSVTIIGEKAFYCCTSLNSVIIPNSVTEIGYRAFADCLSMTEINVDSNNSHYTSLDGVLFSKDIRTLVQYPAGKQLESYVIPNSVTKIGDSAFEVCRNLNSVTLGNSVIEIGEDAFSECSGLASVNMSNSIISIGKDAFYECYRLTSITIPNSVTAIGDDAFSYCSGLTSVAIGNSVKTIGYAAFNDCSGLTSVTIPSSVTKIGDKAFSECSGLTSVAIGNSVDTIGNWAFYRCTGLTSVSIPNSVTSIGGSAFSNCSGLISAAIGNSVETIGSSAFYGCSGLRKVAYPENIENPFENVEIAIAYNPSGAIVEDGFVYGRRKRAIYFAPTNLAEDYVIPESVESIGEYAFCLCSNLKNLYCLTEKPAEAFENTFDKAMYKDVTLYVPETALRNYEDTDPWGQFYNIEVISPDAAITVSPESVILNIGDTTTLTATLRAMPEGANVLWASSNTAIATVDIDGTVTAIAEGMTTITATCCGKSATCTVIIKPNSGIKEINAISSAPAIEVYNMRGVKVGESLEGLPKGIYIVREGGKSRKVAL